MASFFVCSAAGPFPAFDVEEHPHPKRRSKTPGYGPSNPCGKLCKECSLKVELLWPEGPSMRVLVGPDTTCETFLTWSHDFGHRQQGSLCLVVGEGLPDLDSPASSWGLITGVSKLKLVYSQVPNTGYPSPPNTVDTPPAALLYPPPTNMACPPPADLVYPLLADMAHPVPAIEPFQQPAPTVDQPPVAMDYQPAAVTPDLPVGTEDLNMGDSNWEDDLWPEVVVTPEDFADFSALLDLGKPAAAPQPTMPSNLDGMVNLAEPAAGPPDGPPAVLPPNQDVVMGDAPSSDGLFDWDTHDADFGLGSGFSAPEPFCPGSEDSGVVFPPMREPTPPPPQPPRPREPSSVWEPSAPLSEERDLFGEEPAASASAPAVAAKPRRKLALPGPRTVG